jgi:hypothetical protein
LDGVATYPGVSRSGASSDIYITKGAELGFRIGPLKLGFNYEQVSHDGGMSFTSSPNSYNFWDFKASSEGVQVEYSPPVEAFGGFKVAMNLAKVCTQESH